MRLCTVSRFPPIYSGVFFCAYVFWCIDGCILVYSCRVDVFWYIFCVWMYFGGHDTSPMCTEVASDPLPQLSLFT